MFSHGTCGALQALASPLGLLGESGKTQQVHPGSTILPHTLELRYPCPCVSYVKSFQKTRFSGCKVFTNP